jgi:hypothetical protein
MENTAPSSTKVAFKWSIICTIVAIIITYTFQFLNIDQNSGIKYVGIVPFIAFLLLAQKEFKDQLGGYLTFGQGFGVGFKFSLFTGLIMAVFIYVYLAILSPQILDQALATQQDQMTQKGMTSEQIDQAMSIAKHWGPLFGALGTIIFDAIIGAIIALIGAAIFKKDPPMFAAVNDSETVE